MNWARHPILCLYRCAKNPLARFLTELLIQEGYMCFDSLELDSTRDVTAALSGRALVFVCADTVTAAEAEAIRQYVRQGGAAILVKPPGELVDGLGLPVEERPGASYAAAPPGYLQFVDHPWVAHHAAACAQCHAPTALWRIGGARPLAKVAIQRETASSYPAIIEAECGAGRLAIFWFDLGASIVLTRQGDPRLTSTGQWPDADADGMHKPAGLFYRHLDFALRRIPQADILADVLVGVIRGLTDQRLPIPRLWHMPHDAPALTLLDGDSDCFRWDYYDQIMALCREHAVPFTLNLHPGDFKKIDPVAVDGIFRAGNDLELHYWSGNPLAAIDEARRAISEQHRTFQTLANGRKSVGSRGHSGIWPGYTEMAETLAKEGFRLDTNFFALRGYQWGYLNGSGRAARFMTLDGRLLEISQQATLMMDDCVLNEKSLLPALAPDEIYEQLTELYEQAVKRYHGVLNLCIHPAFYQDYKQGQTAILQAVFDAGRKHHLPALTVRDWVAFQEARRRVDVILEDKTWRLKADAPIEGLTCHAPAGSGSRRQGLNWHSTTHRLEPGHAAQIAAKTK